MQGRLGYRPCRTNTGLNFLSSLPPRLSASGRTGQPGCRLGFCLAAVCFMTELGEFTLSKQQDPGT